jgi:transcriptional regulator with XRE-family HTH domain
MERNERSLRRFGQQLTILREQKQLSIQDLSKRSGVNSRQLIRIEAGQVNILFTTILALARGLGIPPEELLEFL